MVSMEVIVNQRHSVLKYTGNAQFHTWVRLLSIWKWWRIWARGGCAKCAILSAPPPSPSCSCCRHGAGVVEFHCMLQLCVQCAAGCSVHVEYFKARTAQHCAQGAYWTLDIILEWTAQCTMCTMCTAHIVHNCRQSGGMYVTKSTRCQGCNTPSSAH